MGASLLWYDSLPFWPHMSQPHLRAWPKARDMLTWPVTSHAPAVISQLPDESWTSIRCCCGHAWAREVLSSATELPHSVGGPVGCSNYVLGGVKSVHRRSHALHRCFHAVLCEYIKCTIRRVLIAQNRKIIICNLSHPLRLVSSQALHNNTV